MSSLKIIPVFFLFMVLTYLGIQFVEANRDDVVVTLGNWQSHPTSLGFVVITSCFCGMFFSATISLAELMRLYLQNNRLKRTIASLQSSQPQQALQANDVTPPKTSGRFT